ncbi:MAG TPA: acyltransferase [Pseudonocardiaceae bacterium]|jgi:peptidoglycan/LPS O-acetylase OafA/YrhL|nr:acyltransferase [Pseudonocardiaceae bacterium]
MAVPEPRTGRLHGLDALRAIASLAVLYVHLSAWFRFHGGPTSFTTWLDRWVIEPAHLNQDLGFLGFAVFFVVSGFVISAVGMRETVPEFAVKRVIRIFPALMVAVLLAWVLVVTGHYEVPDGHPDVGLRDLLMNSVLVNFFVPGNATLVGVAWTLVIQLAIYAMVCVLLPLYRREPWLVIAIEITVCSVVLSVVRNYHGLATSTVANIGAFGTAVILGQVVWAVWSRRLAPWAGAGLGLACWLVFLWGDAMGYGRYDDSYPLTLCFALLITIMMVLAEERIRFNRVLSWLSSRSYSTYLLHQTVAFSVLTATLTWNRWLAGALALGCTFVAVEILHRTVERPTGRLAPALLLRIRQVQARRRPPADTASLEPAPSGIPG